MSNVMGNFKKLTVVALAVLALAGCSAPVDDRQQRTEEYLEAMTDISSGEAVSEALKEAGWFEGVATDLIEGCGKVGMPGAYASQIPDSEDAILEAYEIACPSE